MAGQSSIRIFNTFRMDRWDAMDQFLSEAYSPGHLLRDRRFFKWMFCPQDNDNEANVICAWDGNNLIGILGYLQGEVFWGESPKKVDGAWAVNWIVLEAYRQGLGWILMRRLCRMFPVVLGIGGSQKNIEIVSQTGFTVYEHIPRYVGISDENGIAGFLAAGGIFTAQYPVTHSTGTVSDPGGACTFLEVTGKIRKDDYDPAWENYPALWFGTVRNLDYLQRHYLDHPVFRYRLLLCGDAKKPSVCVFRIEETSGVAAIKVGRIVELFHPCDTKGREAGQALLARAIDLMKDEGCLYYDFFCSSSEYGNTAIRCGLMMEDAMKLPVRLNPVDFSSEGCRYPNLEFFTSLKGLSKPRLSDMYVTKSDGDQDRPNYFLKHDLRVFE